MDGKPHLPLAFGDSEASECRSLLEFSEATRKVFPTLRDYIANRPRQFRTRTAATSINRLTLFAAAIPEIQTAAVVDGSDQQTFVFHLDGVCEFQMERRIFCARAESSAVLIPKNCSWIVHTFNPSTVTVSINADQLRSTAEAMLGPDTKLTSEEKFLSPVELPLSLGRLSFHPLFRQSFSQIDHYGDAKSVLDSSGLDDALCRTLVLCAMPARFLRESEKHIPTVNHRQLRRVCDYVVAGLDTPISLTDLERLSHMSRRTLHNAFKKSFGMSPMAWVREQRLLKARTLLSKFDEPTTVTQALYRCGFTDASLFSAYYLDRFGEHPSATLARSRIGK